MASLPHNRQLEIEILVETFSSPEWRRADIIGRMEPEYFYHDRLRKLWIMSVEDGTEPHIAYDILWEKDHQLKAFLDRDAFLLECRNRRAYYESCSSEPDLVDPDLHNGADNTIERLWKLWQRREAILYVKHQMLPDLEKGKTPLHEAANRFFMLAAQDSGNEDFGVKCVTDEILQDFSTGSDATIVNAFGMPKVDEMLRGLRREDFMVIAAPPGTGKTTLGLEFLIRRAKMGYGKNVVFSFEMSRKQVAQTLLSKYTKIPVDMFTFGYPDTPGKEEAMAAVVDGLAFIDKHFIIYEASIRRRKAFTPERLRAMVLNDMAKCSADGTNLDCVMVDYIQLLGQGNEELTLWTRSIKELALEVKVPMLCVSSLNREYEKNVRYAIQRGKRPPTPIMADLRDCGNIEFDASKILFLIKDYDETGQPFQEYRILRLEKSKFGPFPLEERLSYEGKIMSFGEYE
jgi:replicative DNA helicase